MKRYYSKKILTRCIPSNYNHGQQHGDHTITINRRNRASSPPRIRPTIFKPTFNGRMVNIRGTSENTHTYETGSSNKIRSHRDMSWKCYKGLNNMNIARMNQVWNQLNRLNSIRLQTESKGADERCIVWYDHTGLEERKLLLAPVRVSLLASTPTPTLGFPVQIPGIPFIGSMSQLYNK